MLLGNQARARQQGASRTAGTVESTERLRRVAMRINVVTSFNPHLLALPLLGLTEFIDNLPWGWKPPPPTFWHSRQDLVKPKGRPSGCDISAGCACGWWGSSSGDLLCGEVPPRGEEPSPELGGGGTPETVELALHKIGGSLGELNAHEVAQTVGWMFLKALDRVTMEKGTLLQEMSGQEHELWDAMREGKRLKTEIALLRDVLVA